jgi:hypothetical protein
MLKTSNNMPKHNNYVYFAVGLLFALFFVGANAKVAKANYVDYINGQEVEVRYNNDTGKLDIYDLNNPDEPIASDVDFTLDSNGRGVPDVGQMEEKTGTKDYNDIKQPEGEETQNATGGWVTDSSEREEDYSCTQVGGCSTDVIGYRPDVDNPTYALNSRTDVQEVITVYLRDSGQASGNDAWIKAGEIMEDMNKTNESNLTVTQVNELLTVLGSDIQLSGEGTVTRGNLLSALNAASAEKSGEECDQDVWSCGSWSVCSMDGEQSRICDLSYNCPGVSTPSPEETRTCTPPEILTECTFTATPTEILYSKSSQLNWNCNQTNGCSIKDEFGLVIESSLPIVSGGAKVTPLKTTRYYLNCPENKTWETVVRVFSSGIQ